MLAATRGAGIDVTRVEIVAGAATAGYTALLDSTGGLVVAFADMAIYDGFDGARSADAAAGAARWFVEANLPASALAAVAARKPTGVFLAADAVSVAKSERLRGILPALDLLFVNRDEARALTGSDSPTEAATRLRAAGVSAVIVMIGVEGALAADGSGYAHLPSAPVKVRDVTGAGDALIAATLDSLAKDHSFNEAVRRGIAVASLTIAYPGAVRPDLAAALDRPGA